MKRSASLASRAASTALKTVSQEASSSSSSSSSSINHRKINGEKAPNSGPSETPISAGNKFISSSLYSDSDKPILDSSSKASESAVKCIIPVDQNCVSQILGRKDWFLLLKHEFKAKRLILTSRFVVSVLQNQENPLHSLRFYIWFSNTDLVLANDQSLKNALADALCRKGPVLFSAELLQEIRDFGCRLTEDLVCVLIGSWGRLGLYKYCNEVFGQISFLGISPSTRLYNAVIDALVKSNSLDLAYLKFQQMPLDSCKPDRFTYNILIHGVCKKGVVDEAIRLVKQMEREGYKPNVFTYTILMDGFFNVRRVGEAFKLVETMQRRNVSPNEATVRSLIHGVFRCVPPSKAFELLLGFMEKTPILQRLACDTLLYCLSNKCMAREVALFLRKMLERGYVPDSSMFNVTMTCLLKGFNNLSETCEILDSFVSQGVKPGLSIYLGIVQALYKDGKSAEGDPYISQMEMNGLISSVYSYNMLIDCFCKANMMDRAKETLNKMQHRGISPNLVTFNTLISGCCKEGDACKAREMLEKLLEHGCKPDVFTFSSIIDSLCRAHEIGDALDCFNEMVEWRVSPNAVTYNIIIRSLCIIGDVGRSMRLLRQMKENGLEPDIYSFNALIQSFCRMDKVERAEKLFKSMLRLGLNPDNYTYSALIKALCESGRVDEAKEMFFSMEKNGCAPDSYTHNLIEEIQTQKSILGKQLSVL